MLPLVPFQNTNGGVTDDFLMNDEPWDNHMIGSIQIQSGNEVDVVSKASSTANNSSSNSLSTDDRVRKAVPDLSHLVDSVLMIS